MTVGDEIKQVMMVMRYGLWTSYTTERYGLCKRLYHIITNDLSWPVTKSCTDIPTHETQD
jgi:hypothetical protein